MAFKYPNRRISLYSILILADFDTKLAALCSNNYFLYIKFQKLSTN
jgi:hypothetical protein